MTRQALLIGISSYADDYGDLDGPPNDVRALKPILERHGAAEHGANFRAEILQGSVSRGSLRDALDTAFLRAGGTRGDVLIYFSGHGGTSHVGGELVTSDGTTDAPGLPMYEIELLARKHRPNSLTVILDCCNAGRIAETQDHLTADWDLNTVLQYGMSLFAASQPTGYAEEDEEGDDARGIFSRYVERGLEGEAADAFGRVTVASLFSYLEDCSHIVGFEPVYKICADKSFVLIHHPARADNVLRGNLIALFGSAGGGQLQLNLGTLSDHDRVQVLEIAAGCGMLTGVNSGVLEGCRTDAIVSLSGKGIAFVSA